MTLLHPFGCCFAKYGSIFFNVLTSGDRPKHYPQLVKRLRYHETSSKFWSALRSVSRNSPTSLTQETFSGRFVKDNQILADCFVPLGQSHRWLSLGFGFEFVMEQQTFPDKSCWRTTAFPQTNFTRCILRRDSLLSEPFTKDACNGAGL